MKLNKLRIERVIEESKTTRAVAAPERRSKREARAEAEAVLRHPKARPNTSSWKAQGGLHEDSERALADAEAAAAQAEAEAEAAQAALEAELRAQESEEAAAAAAAEQAEQHEIEPERAEL